MIAELVATAPLLGTLILLFYAAAIDVVRFEIPNTVSILIGALGVAHGLMSAHFDWTGHLLAPLLMFAFGLAAFAVGWLGGGDVKLMTAVSVWTGLRGLPPFFLATALAGGVLVLVLTGGRRLWPALARGGEPPPLFSPGGKIPYAVAIALGAVWWAAVTGTEGLIWS